MVPDKINIRGKDYKITTSSHGNFYIEKPFYVDYDIPNPMSFASRFGNLSNAKIPTFVEEKQFEYFLEVIRSINDLPSGFIKIAREQGFLGNFLYNLTEPIQTGDILVDPYSYSDIVLHNIIWETSLQGHEYWSDIYNILKTLENANKLQNKTVDRSRDDRSERNRLRGGGDIVESSTRYSGYQASARKRKNALGGHKVYLSSRRGCIHRR